MPMTSPTVVYVFTGNIAHGDMFDAQFNDHKGSIDSVISAVNDVRRSDGALKNGIVTLDSLAPGLIDALTTPITDATSADVVAAGASATNANISATQANNARIAAEAAEASAQVHADDVNAAAGTALAQALAAQVAITDAATSISTSTGAAENAKNYAEGAAEEAGLYADAAQAWAEYMPGIIPPNILAVMGITGDHWSSRWWANKASQDVATILDARDRAEDAAVDAEAAKVAAQTAATNAQASFDSFDDRYLGAKAVVPTLDNDGNGLLTGALYFDTTLNEMRVWSGTAWQAFTGPTSLYATDVVVTPFTGVSATNVQLALQEIQTEYTAADAATLSSANSHTDSEVNALEAYTNGEIADLQAQIDTHDTQIGVIGPLASGAVPKAGGTMTGALILYAAPSSDMMAANKKYVDDATTVLANGKVAKAGDTMTGPLVLSGAPTLGGHATTKTYVDTGDAAATAVANGKVSKTGDTMTGGLTIQQNGAEMQFWDTGAAANRKRSRFVISGGSTYLQALTDAGAFLSQGFQFDHATGRLTTSVRPLFGTATPWDGLNFPMDITTVPPTAGDAPVWDGTKFVPGLSGGAVISDTPPTLKQGGLWWESDSGTLFIGYKDGTSDQWVQVGGGASVYEAPIDEKAYVRQNGSWAQAPRLQTFDLGGVSQIDIPVPASAVRARLVFSGLNSAAANHAAILRMSVSAGVFDATGTSYLLNGQYHYTGLNPTSVAAWSSDTSYTGMLLAASHGATTLPLTFTAELNLTRTPANSTVWSCKSEFMALGTSNGVISGRALTFMQHAASGGLVRPLAFRLLSSTGQTWASPSTLTVEWF